VTESVGDLDTGNFAKERLLGILGKLLDSDLDLGFLQQLNERSLEELIVAVRMRIEK
jgi:hypothetical protein